MRDGPLLYVQWKGKRVVNVISTRNLGTQHVEVERKKKVGGVLQTYAIKKLLAIEEYTASMGC